MIETLIPVVATVALSAFLRGLTGFGFALAAVPIMSLVVMPVQAVTITVLLQVVIGTREVFSLHGLYDKQEVTRLSLGAIIGTPIGVMLLTHMDANTARIMIAVVVVCGLAFLLRRPKHHRPATTPVTCAVGAMSGLFAGLASMPGPPAVAYFLTTGAPPTTSRASLMIFFFVTALLALPGLMIAHAIDQTTLLYGALTLPALFIGTWLGTQVFLRLKSNNYRSMAIAVMVLSALLTGWRGLFG